MRLVAWTPERSRASPRRRHRRLRPGDGLPGRHCWRPRRGYIAGTRAPAGVPRGRHARSGRHAARLRLRLHLGARPVVARPGTRCAAPGRPPDLAHRLLRGGRAARAPGRAGPRARRAQLRAPAADGAPARTTLLSTPEADEQRSRAWRLYRRFGFVDVLRALPLPRRRARRSPSWGAPCRYRPSRPGSTPPAPPGQLAVHRGAQARAPTARFCHTSRVAVDRLR